VRFCLLLLVGCGRLNFDAIDGLVVTTIEDRLAGPPTMMSEDEVLADDLSLREALTIAANRPKGDAILFSGRVFPFDAPGVITLDSTLEVAGSNTVVDASGRGVVIEGRTNFDLPQIHITGDSNVVLGVTVRGGMATRILVEDAVSARVDTVRFAPPGAGAIRVENSRQVLLAALTIEQPAGIAIEITTTTDLKVKAATIEQPQGVAIAASNSTELEILNSTIVLDKTADQPGIQLDTVDRSKIHDNVIDPGPVQLINLNSSSNNEIVGNILDGGNAGITLFGASLANLCFRNVIMNCSSEAVAIDDIALGNRMINTTIYMSNGISNGAADTEITGTLETAEPGDFRDPARYDFRLALHSPSIDAGTDLGLDYLPDLPERFLGSAPDLGAVETL
jgi:Right handed beta helix region